LAIHATGIACVEAPRLLTRFTVINRAARVARIHGRRILRFSQNPATQVLYDQVLDRLAA
jgi:hypothetical protein